MNLLTRRVFLEKLSAFAAGNFIASAAALSARANDNAEPHISFPIAPRDRIAIASYPFRAYIESPGNRDRNPSLPGMDLIQFPAEVVKKFGIHNIEPHSRHFRSLDPAYLATFREELSKRESGEHSRLCRREFLRRGSCGAEQSDRVREEMGGNCRQYWLPKHSRPQSARVELGTESAADGRQAS